MNFTKRSSLLYSLEPCGNSDWKGDGICDDENNHEGCEYDGGDCCGSNVDTNWCNKCLCLDPNFPGKWEKLKTSYNKLPITANSEQN